MLEKIKDKGGQELFGENDRFLLIQAIRLTFNLAILIITLILQAVQSNFSNPDVWVPIYLMLGLSFTLSSVFVLFFENLFRKKLTNALLLSFDTVVITFLIYHTGVNQSIFLFLYLVNIILCGLIFQRKGAVLLAIWTSVLFSMLLIIGTEGRGDSLYLVVGFNNLAFFSVAILSGIYSEQINFLGGEVIAKSKEIGVLRDFNKLIVDNVQSGLMTLDRDLLITYCNASGIEILEKKQVVGDSIDRFFEDLKTEIEKSGRNSLQIDTSYEVRDDKKILEIVASPLFDTSEHIRGYVVMFNDRTEVKQMEYQLRQQEKMAAVGQLAAGIAHEIRNPLASISGSIEMLSTTKELVSDDDKQLMKIVLREIDRLNNLISEFLEFVKPGERPQAFIDVNSVINEIIEVLPHNPKINQKVEKKIHLNASQLVLGSPGKLKQVFLNIIINSYQAMGDDENASIDIQTYDNGGAVVVSITDTGCGMSEENLSRIFEPFHTTKSKGTGLGMAVSHKILQEHGAKVFVESTVNVGTKFTMEFMGTGENDDEKTLRKLA